jgi:hypothetical protein
MTPRLYSRRRREERPLARRGSRSAGNGLGSGPCPIGVRKLPVAAVISTVVHVAVGALWLSHEAARVAPGGAPRIAVVTAPAPDPAFEVQIIDLSTEAPAASGRGTSSPDGRAQGRIASVAGTVSRSPVGSAEPGPEVTSPPEHPRATLSMRGRDRRSELLTLPSRVIDDLLAKPPAPIPDLPGARIDSQIAELQSKLRNQGYVANATPDQIGSDRIELVALRAARRAVELVRERDGSYTTHKDRFVARVDPDGKVHLTDKRNLEAHFYGLGLAGRFDITDWAMRSRGMDPYASEKLKYLDRTRDQRVAIGQEYRRAELAQSGVSMQRNIERLWASTSEVTARKQGLFDLWDDCAESGSAELVAGAAAARTRVVQFIQVTMRGDAAFTTADLARLNTQRRSAVEFAPYE